MGVVRSPRAVGWPGGHVVIKGIPADVPERSQLVFEPIDWKACVLDMAVEKQQVEPATEIVAVVGEVVGWRRRVVVQAHVAIIVLVVNETVADQECIPGGGARGGVASFSSDGATHVIDAAPVQPG